MVTAAVNGKDAPATGVVERNIEALLARRRKEAAEASWQDQLAGKIACFAGQMSFVWLHLAIYGGWILANLGLVPGMRPFDPTFVALAMIASVEALFLSTFILITQNRMQAQADRRADLNLQISLLAEHEITRLVAMVTEIGERMNIVAARSPDLRELKEDVQPEHLLETLERREAEAVRDRDRKQS